MSLERSVTKWLGVEISDVIFTSNLLNFNLLSDVVNYNKEMFTFLQVRLAIVMPAEMSSIIIAGSWRAS